MCCICSAKCVSYVPACYDMFVYIVQPFIRVCLLRHIYIYIYIYVCVVLPALCGLLFVRGSSHLPNVDAQYHNHPSGMVSMAFAGVVHVIATTQFSRG